MIIFIAYLIVTIFLLLGVIIYIFLNDTDSPVKIPPTASETLSDMLKDPLVTSRAYFTEPATGPIGDFVGYSPVSQDDWLHSFSHKEPQDKRSKYDKIRSLIQIR